MNGTDMEQVKSTLLFIQKEADHREIKYDAAVVGAAVLVNDGSVIGFNAPGLNGHEHCNTHAEIQAIDNFKALRGGDLSGLVMVVNRSPCEYCAAHIIASGITEVYCPPIRIGSKWRESQEIGRRIMEHVGINVVEIELEGVRG